MDPETTTIHKVVSYLPFLRRDFYITTQGHTGSWVSQFLLLRPNIIPIRFTEDGIYLSFQFQRVGVLDGRVKVCVAAGEKAEGLHLELQAQNRESKF